jgi:hypothetical protein
MTALQEEGLAVIDQGAEAREAGLELRDTTLVIFGSPAARTAVALGDGGGVTASPRPGVQEQCWPAGASLQADEEDGCGKDEAVQDRGPTQRIPMGSVAG